MENANSGFKCHLIKSKEGASPFADSAFSFFEERIEPFCAQYFSGLANNGAEEFFEHAFEGIAEAYISSHQAEIEDYIEKHKDEHDAAIKEPLFQKGGDPEKAYRLSLLCANYVLYCRKGEDALIVDLSANVPLPHVSEDKPVEMKKEKPVTEPVVMEAAKEPETQEEQEPDGEIDDVQTRTEEPKEEDPFSGIKRKSFSEKLRKSPADLKGNYKEIRKAALEHDLKERVSKNSATYHLGRKTYLKMAIVGKTLRCYFAVPKDKYDDTAIPLEDVSDKKAYEDTPSLLRVRSSLSMRRAVKLISDMMEEGK